MHSLLMGAQIQIKCVPPTCPHSSPLASDQPEDQVSPALLQVGSSVGGSSLFWELVRNAVLGPTPDLRSQKLPLGQVTVCAHRV